MALYSIGNFINQRREELGITQDDLAEGLCSVTTLSRLENCEQTPRSGTVRALLQRLGYSGALLFQAVGREEFEISQLQVKIVQMFNSYDRSGVPEALVKLDGYRDFFSKSDRQFYEIIYAVFYKDRFTNDEMLQRLESALRITHPKYSIDNLPNFLTYEEATALNAIAGALEKKNEREAAIKVLYHLRDFYSKDIVDKQEVLKALPIILYNLSKLLGLSGKYDECIEICNQGIKLMKDNARGRYLAVTLYNLSWALVKKGRACDIEPAKQALKEAYCFALVIDRRPSFIERLKKFSIENFGEELPSIL